MILTEEEYLEHHGILGMHWGIRKGRNQLSKLSGRSKSSITDEEATTFRSDVKQARKKGLAADFHTDEDNGSLHIDQWYNSENQKIGKDYAEQVMKQAAKGKTVKALATTAAVIAGASIAGKVLASLS